MANTVNCSDAGPKQLSVQQLISPELARLGEGAKDIAGLSLMLQTHRHRLSNSIVARQDRNIQELMSTIQGFTNPFTKEAKVLYSIATKAVMPDGVRQDLISEHDIVTIPKNSLQNV